LSKTKLKLKKSSRVFLLEITCKIAKGRKLWLSKKNRNRRQTFPLLITSKIAKNRKQWPKKKRGLRKLRCWKNGGKWNKLNEKRMLIIKSKKPKSEKSVRIRKKRKILLNKRFWTERKGNATKKLQRRQKLLQLLE